MTSTRRQQVNTLQICSALGHYLTTSAHPLPSVIAYFADLAEEAAGIDDEIISDRMYKALMAKNVRASAQMNLIITFLGKYPQCGS